MISQLVSRHPIKGIGKTIKPVIQVTLHLVFGVPTSHLVFSKPIHAEKQRKKAVAPARTKMEAITAELTIRRALHTKLPLVTQYHSRSEN